MDNLQAPLEPQEDEDDIITGESDVSFDAAIAASDWTTETIISQLRKGNIDLDPSFQRREAWREGRKSKFVESLMIGIPTPQVILAERKERRGTYIVIDGKQRLLTLRQFTASEEDQEFDSFKLSGLKVLKRYNGRTFGELTELDDDPISMFENAVIRTVIIKNWSSEEFLYEVFLRINSGSVQLSPQELRQALHPGGFTRALNKYALDSGPIKRVLGLSQPDFRMRDNELALRYIAFARIFSSYSGNLKKFLDDITTSLNSAWHDEAASVQRNFANLDDAISGTYLVFGDDAFRKWNGSKFESRVNRAVFDVMAYYFSDADVRERAIAQADAVKAGFVSLSESDDEFSESISTTTKSKTAVSKRFDAWGQALRALLGEDIRIPQIQTN